MLETIRLSWHVVRRNWAVYRKDLISNISPTVADPLLFLLSLGVGLGAYVSGIEGQSYSEFLAPGLIMSTALMTAFFESSYGFYVRMSFENVYKAMLTTPIGVREVIIGEFIWVSLKGAVMSLGVGLVLAGFGLAKSFPLLVFLPLLGALVSLPCGAMGLIATSFVKNINQFQTVYSFVIAPLFFFSGIFFPVERQILPIKIIAYAFPLANGVKLGQNIFWATSFSAESWLHLGALLLQCLVFGGFAFWRIKKILEH